MFSQKLLGEQRSIPRQVLMLDSLFRCNLACFGCGKTDYQEEVLDWRLSIEDLFDFDKALLFDDRSISRRVLGVKEIVTIEDKCIDFAGGIN